MYPGFFLLYPTWNLGTIGLIIWNTRYNSSLGCQNLSEKTVSITYAYYQLAKDQSIREDSDQIGNDICLLRFFHQVNTWPRVTLTMCDIFILLQKWSHSTGLLDDDYILAILDDSRSMKYTIEKYLVAGGLQKLTSIEEGMRILYPISCHGIPPPPSKPKA